MALNLAGKTYEVYSGDGQKWVYEGTFDVKSKAMRQAEALLAARKADGVRVIAESPRKGEEIVFEESGVGVAKAMTIVPVETSPVCRIIDDLFALDARRTAGRLLRRYLDDAGMTALELACDPFRLRMLERAEAFFAQAIGRLGAIQSRETGDQQRDRIDQLYRLFEDLRQWALTNRDFEQAGDTADACIRRRGLDAFIAQVDEETAPEMVRRRILAGLAALLADEGDWDGKAAVLIGLLANGPSERAQGYIDDVLAEILDGPAALTEILGGVADTAYAHQELIQLSKGNLPKAKNPISCINDLNEALCQFRLPHTQGVLVDRVASGLGGVRPLTRSGPQADRSVLVALIRDLASPEGVRGGPHMAEAVTARARITFATEDGDLPFAEGMARVIDLLPLLAARAGYLLDLSASPAIEKFRGPIMQALMATLSQMRHIGALAPSGNREIAECVLDRLKAKMARAPLPKELVKSTEETLCGLLDVPPPTPPSTPSETPSSRPAQADAPAKRKDRRYLGAGEVLFEEGDPGAEAYLVISGALEVFRRGEEERHLAEIGRGDLIGEMSLIDDQPRMASARAVEATELLVVSKESLKVRLDKLEQTDKVVRRLLDLLVGRLRGLARSVE